MSTVFAILAGGGTAGHVVPALSVAQALVAKGHDPSSLRFVGSARGVEVDLVPAAGFPLTTLPGRGIKRSFALSNIGAVIGLLGATGQAIGILWRTRPRVVVNLGGYASVPCTLAAVLLRVPIVVVSYDSVPGAASRLAARVARASAVALSGTALPRAVVTGAPVRPEVLALDTSPEGRLATRRELGLPTDRQLLVVTSGSLGARRVNEAVTAMTRDLADRHDLVIFHAVGRRDFETVCTAAREGEADRLDYRPVAFEARLPAVLSTCDLAVSRAGASTIAELVVLGVPSILVPLPGAPADHQTRNAEVLVAAGAAVLLRDDECSAAALGDLVTELLAEPGRRESMARAAASLGRRDAADRIAALVESNAKAAA